MRRIAKRTSPKTKIYYHFSSTTLTLAKRCIKLRPLVRLPYHHIRSSNLVVVPLRSNEKRRPAPVVEGNYECYGRL
jgi:hypothetical protein